MTCSAGIDLRCDPACCKKGESGDSLWDRPRHAVQDENGKATRYRQAWTEA